MITLYTIDSAGRTRNWNCRLAEKDGVFGIEYSDGIVGGKQKDYTFKEAKEKNVGKNNYLSPEAQSHEMLEQETGKKERKNYFRTVEDAKTKKLFLPMLAHKYSDHGKNLIFPAGSQVKLDGARCNVYYCPVAKEVVIRTRTGKAYNSVPHILEGLREFCESNKSIVLDGELYNHDFRNDFETIMSLVRQSKPTENDLERSSKLVQFHVYDVYVPLRTGMPFKERMNLILSMADHMPKCVVLVPTTVVNDVTHLDSLQEEYLEDGYEGQMVRGMESVYKDDGRSKDLLKRKIFIDDEFPIVRVEEGEGAWKGCAKRVIIKLPDGREQGTGIDGNFAVNRERFENRDELVGKLATVRFFRFTKDGKLYIPVTKDIARHD